MKLIKLSKTQHKIYDFVMGALACAAVILIIIELSGGLNVWQNTLSDIILGIFVADYAIRFFVADNKKKFVRENICDLLAILPFHIVFRSFRLVHLGRWIKYVKIPRMLAFLYRPFKKAVVFLNINGFKYILLMTSVIILIGGVLIHFAEDMSISDGIWWAFVTATTVGYGDISPNSLYGRLIAMVLMLVGIGLIGSVTSTLTSYFLKKDRQNVESRTIQMIQEELEHFSELSEEDVDRICVILKGLKQKNITKKP